MYQVYSILSSLHPQQSTQPVITQHILIIILSSRLYRVIDIESSHRWSVPVDQWSQDYLITLDKCNISTVYLLPYCPSHASDLTPDTMVSLLSSATWSRGHHSLPNVCFVDCLPPHFISGVIIAGTTVDHPL